MGDEELDLDEELGLLPHEALCPVHHLTYNRALPACPECVEESRVPSHSVR